MKRILSLTAAAALVFTTVASAQLLNYPVNVNPHHGTGVGIAVLGAKGMNDNSGKITTFGLGGRIGFGMINIAAGAATNSPDGGGDSKTDFGANAEFVAISGGLFAGSIFAGFGTMSDVGTTIPLGVGLSVAPPGGIFSVWAAPAYILFTPSSTICSDCSNGEIGVSGGVRLGFPMGLGLGVSMQWVNVEGGAPIVLGASVGWKFGMGG